MYSHDLIADECLKFIRSNKDGPFFCYVPFTIPHVALQVPEDSLSEYKGKWPDPPYDGSKGYFPHPHPRAAYAAMVTRMDRDVGRIMSLLNELHLEDNTLVIFTSDNGPTFNGGSDSQFFESARPLRGLKTMVYEGGIRVPFIARWPGKVKPGTTSDHISAFWDFLPTCCQIIGIDSPRDIDGISMLPTLLGQPEKQEKHNYLYWELGKRQAVRMGNWKGVRYGSKGKLELYDLETDVGESKNIADQNQKIVAKIEKHMKTACTPSELFPLPEYAK